jgi:hypothetical protein
MPVRELKSVEEMTPEEKLKAFERHLPRSDLDW